MHFTERFQAQSPKLMVQLSPGHQGALWLKDPPGLLHLRLFHQPDCDDVADHRRDRRAEQVAAPPRPT